MFDFAKTTTEKILALDPANECGFAHTDGHVGVWILTVHGREHPGMRLLRLRDFIRDSAAAWGCDKLAMEDATFGAGRRNPHTAGMHTELRGVICLTAAELSVPVFTIYPSTLKKWATGSGDADKAQMMRACRTLFGITPRSSDEADAIFVLAAAHQNVQPKSAAKNPSKRPRSRKAKEQELFQ